MTPISLSPLVETPKLRILDTLPADARFLRGEILPRLLAAANSLPDGQQLLVIEAFRIQSRQFGMWNRRIAKLAQLRVLRDLRDGVAAGGDALALIDAALEAKPDIDSLREETRVTVADPVATPSGHQSATAIDVTILHDGEPLDMGCGWSDFAAITPTSNRVQTMSPDITPAQAANRAHLLAVMEAQGLVNYPEEWWHYSYGDRLWHEVLTGRGENPGPVKYLPIFDNPAFAQHHAR
ncbi:M15 family metallopeptidase [Pseudorhodobacter sp.]|uniref:M15 family metallopeptidase n=1 Tax=Pseudorhodobacter sp. TaxID=1934400 RepID=UPI00264824B5|nr:M15 family metallopeptidase [Pseudorhodobacter sp.]MDN5788888.1 hypothetical protein [Pseudorhodobacter sp.]